MSKEPLDWRIPRVRLNPQLGAGEALTYVETAGGGGITPQPVTPYRPQPVVYTATPQFPNYINIAPRPAPPQAFVPSEPQVFIRQTGVKVNVRPQDTYRWDDLRRRAAAIPWRGSRPEQGASSVSVINTLQRREAAGDPDAGEAAQGFVARLERQDAEWQARHQAELQSYYDAGAQQRAAKEAKLFSAAQAQHPGSIVTRTMDEYRAAVAANPGKKVVKLSEDSFWANRAISVAYDVAAAGAKRADVSGRVVEDFGAGTKSISNAAQSGADALLDWIGMSKAAGQKVQSSAFSWEDQAKNLIAPIASQYIGKAAALGFASYFDTYINNMVPTDPSKARSWAQKVYQSLIGFAMHSTKAKDPASKLISSEVTGRWEARLRQDVSEASRTDTPASQDHVDAARRVQEDLKQMRADIADTTTRVVQAQIQSQPVAAAPVIASSNVVVQRPVASIPAKTRTVRRYGPESYDLPE